LKDGFNQARQWVSEKKRASHPSNNSKPNTQNMNTLTKRIVILLFVTALLAIVNTGCNTAHGFGKDMEKAGDKIQDGTK